MRSCRISLSLVPLILAGLAVSAACGSGDADAIGGGPNGPGAGGTADGGVGPLGDGTGPGGLNDGWGEEWHGPFANWTNVKTAYGAKGDGVTDDTSALQAALDGIAKNGKSAVLYLPAGQYVVSRTLRLVGLEGVAVYGEDPTTTSLVWNGPATDTPSADMLVLDGVSYSHLGRLTLDGRGKARRLLQSLWTDAVPLYFPTGNELSDLVLQDAKAGLVVGDAPRGTAETMVARSKFLRLSVVGALTMNFNALDWWFHECWFEDNGDALWNQSGNFHVYNSTFLRSKGADIHIGNKMYFGIRGNYSRGSKRFVYTEGPSGNPSGLTIQNNVVVDWTDPAALQLYDTGPFVILDNVFRSRAGATQAVIDQADFNSSAIVSAGNTFTVPNPMKVGSATPPTTVIELDNRVVDAATLTIPEPSFLGFLPYVKRTVFEVPAGDGKDNGEIQKAIDDAVAAGQRAVVHVQEGNHETAAQVTVPLGADIQITGDGYLRSTVGSGLGRFDAMRIQGRGRIVVRELQLKGGEADTPKSGLVIDGWDAANARIFGDQLYCGTTGDAASGCFFDGVQRARVDLRGFGPSAKFEGSASQAAVKIVGGPGPSTEPNDGAIVNIYSGATANNKTNLDLVGGARATYSDTWFEAAGPLGPFFKLDGPSVLLSESFNHATDKLVPTASFGPAFTGRFVMTNGHPASQLVAPSSLAPAARVVAIANITGFNGGDPKIENEAPDRGFFAGNGIFRNGPYTKLPDQGVPSPDETRASLALLRKRDTRSVATKASAWPTEIRLLRVAARGGGAGLWVKP